MIRAKDAPQNLSAVSPCTAVNMTHFYLCSPLPHFHLLYPFLSYSQSHSDAYSKMFAPNSVLLAFIHFLLLLNPLVFLHIYFFLFLFGPWLSHFLGCIPPLFFAHFSASFSPYPSLYLNLCPGSYCSSFRKCTVQYSVPRHQADCFLSDCTAVRVPGETRSLTSKHLSISLL